MATFTLNNVITGFSKLEVEALTGLTFHKLTYLDRAEILKPDRTFLPGKKQATLTYSWSKVLELRAIAALREDTTLQSIRKLIAFLDEYCDDPRLSSKRVMIYNGEIYWIEPDFVDLPGLMVATSKNPGQLSHYELSILPDLRGEIIKAAKESNIVDFESFLERSNLKEVA
jgi:DNA-binding transcriptional MerR regulator